LFLKNKAGIAYFQSIPLKMLVELEKNKE